MAPVNSISLFGNFQLDSVQTAALREVVYSSVKRVPLVYRLNSIYRDKFAPLTALHHHARGTPGTD